MTQNKHFHCNGKYTSSPNKVIILSRKNSPTRDIYLKYRLKNSRFDVFNWEIGHAPPCDLTQAFVIIIRYVDENALKVLFKYQSRLAGVAYLMDDDIPNAWKDFSLPPLFRIGIGHFWFKYKKALMRLASEHWVCSQALLEKYPGSKRIDPLPEHAQIHCEDRPYRAPHNIHIACHTSTTHLKDTAWLKKVAIGVQKRCSHTHFEIIGHHHALKKFKKIPRTKVIASMRWDEYQKHLNNAEYDLSLVPLLDTSYNRHRSWLKYMDIANWGAVGIFSDCPIYREVVQNGHNGYLVPMDNIERWIELIVMLSNNHKKRFEIIRNITQPQKIHTPDLLKKFM